MLSAFNIGKCQQRITLLLSLIHKRLATLSMNHKIEMNKVMLKILNNLFIAIMITNYKYHSYLL